MSKTQISIYDAQGEKRASIETVAQFSPRQALSIVATHGVEEGFLVFGENAPADLNLAGGPSEVFAFKHWKTSDEFQLGRVGDMPTHYGLSAPQNKTEAPNGWIYANILGNLLWLRGDYVVNGAYDVERIDDHTVKNSNTTYSRLAPAPAGRDYRDVLYTFDLTRRLPIETAIEALHQFTQGKTLTGSHQLILHNGALRDDLAAYGRYSQTPAGAEFLATLQAHKELAATKAPAKDALKTVG